MFSDKKPKEIEPQGTNQNRINEGTVLKGDITSNGYFRIDGTIEGNVKTPSKVVIGKTGVVIGTLSCKNADIEGKVKGIVDISGTLSLKSTAYIEGEVVIGKLSVEPGAVFNATCLMKDSSKETSSIKVELEVNKPNPYDRQQRAASNNPSQQSES
ncbi:MAG: cell shape determination protein CcmA [Flavobacterium sp.]|nr:MAG: cell shape determination protein CcmA [Flavobacterium sp.]